MTVEAIRKAAARLVDRVDVGPAPVDTAAVARALGVPVAHERLDAGVTGALIATPAGPALCLNSAQPANRQRLVLAHMIGHLQLGHRFEGRVHVEGCFEAYRDERPYTPAERMEYEANVFGASLLMPTRLLRASVQALTTGRLTDDDIQQLATAYGVSVQGMTLRLATTGLL